MQPLTIEQLKALKSGDYIWAIFKGYKEGGYLQIFDSLGERYFLADAHTMDITMEDYGKKWFAYKNKEQAEGIVSDEVKQAQIAVLEQLNNSEWKCSAQGRLHIRYVHKKINKFIKEIKDGQTT